MGVCQDCLVTVDGLPNVRACMTPVRDRLRVETQRGLGDWSMAQ
jgi:predicted molibdopterin-dependent oxidoreductase YjgC